MLSYENATAVIGAGFGDEGKGRVVDWLSRKANNPIIIRFNGGQQAGHTVIDGRRRHVFSNFGSGTFSDAPTFWSRFCTFDPDGFLRERDILKSLGANPKIFVDRRSPLTTPVEKMISQQGKYYENGTCGVGFGPTIEREETGVSLVVGDIESPHILREKWNAISRGACFTKESGEYFLARCQDAISISDIKLVDGPPMGPWGHAIFEGAQGLMLDPKIGFFPHVTRSNTGSKNIMEFAKHPEYLVVTRSYETRHGNGPMTGSLKPVENPHETNKTNTYQGVFRTAELNPLTLRYAINRDSEIKKRFNLVVTCMDLCESRDRMIRDLTQTLQPNDLFTGDRPSGDLI